MNEIKTFTNKEFGAIRTVVIDDEPWFVGKDVAAALGYSDQNKAISMHVDSDDKLNDKTSSSLGQRGGWLINESGMYSLILSSKLPTAKRFKHWVTSEVLPTIRKHGAYMTDEKAWDITHNADSLADLLQQASDQLRRKDIIIEEMKPKALFSDAITSSKTSILIGDLAKILKGNGIDIGQKRLFQWMRENGYLIKGNRSDRNMPTQRSMEMKLFEVKESSYISGDGVNHITKTPKVTGKGQKYFVNKFIKMAESEKDNQTSLFKE
jgi:anti-repressor protein